MVELVATSQSAIVRREVYTCAVCSKSWVRDTPLQPRPPCRTCGGVRR